MRSFLAALQTLVLPYGRTSGPRIVLDGVNGVISVYNAISEFIRLSSAGLRVQGTASEIDLTVDNSGTDSFIIFTDPTQAAPLTWLGHSIVRATPGALGALAVDLWSGYDVATPSSEHSRVLVSDNQLLLTHSDVGGGLATGSALVLWKDRIDVQTHLETEGETWHNIALINGWAARGATWPSPSYRLMPDGTVALRGQMAGGTTADGTKIGNLPAGYRPPKEDNFVISSYPGLNGAILVVQTNGDLNIYNVGAAPTTVGLAGVRIPLI